MSLRWPSAPELVPRGYAASVAPSRLRELRWLLQKRLLRQDVFLIGQPGPDRRRLAMAFLELTGGEVEYVALTRDTTEADLKQRREIRGGTAAYEDLAAVRAALKGRCLVLDGIEKAERNVLPVLNNLLENREMSLDDGRFLLHPDKYDALLKEQSAEELAGMGLERVSEDFHVVALGLPTPAFRGHSLDPPLRSRFQVAHIGPLAFERAMEAAVALAPSVGQSSLSRLLSFAYGANSEESAALALPHFPLQSLPAAARLWELAPELSAQELLARVYPHRAMLKAEAREAVLEAMEAFEVRDPKGRPPTPLTVRLERAADGRKATVATQTASVDVPIGAGASQESATPFVSNEEQERLISEMLLSHSVGDFCLLGSKGCGKSAVVEELGRRLSYAPVTVMCYQDMTGRDLVQRRAMRPDGSTVWEETALVRAVREGSLAVLDGIHRLHHSTLNLLHRLIHDRELELFDGTRFVAQRRYEEVKRESGLSREELTERKVFPIPDSFRIAALAEPSSGTSSAGDSGAWLTPELVSSLLFHEMRPLSAATEARVVSQLVPGVDQALLGKLEGLVGAVRRSADPNLAGLATSLSTRQLLRLGRRMAAFPGECLHSAVHKACLSRFLPAMTRESLDAALADADILPLEKSDKEQKEISCEVVGDKLRIGATEAEVFQPESKAMVPDIVFYENPQQLGVLEDMLRDWLDGEHLLLVGNQGVGKNKIADRFLQLLQRPRHYVQLHRDTTVQSLTVQATVRDGVLAYEDSPLVRAVREGAVLVVDEGDKAPTHVTSVLKSLLDAHRMDLADGRRIVPWTDAPKPNEIPVAPGFRAIVLANRPGFPFLGNDFYAALGDLFACHSVENPAPESEMKLLRSFGPDVPDLILNKLLGAFSDLRQLSDDGLLQYPYSTRELVNIVRHLQDFPGDPLPAVIRNVFDFDAFSKDAQETLGEVLTRHGVPFSHGRKNPTTRLAKKFPLPQAEVMGDWGRSGDSLQVAAEPSAVAFEDARKYRYGEGRLERQDARGGAFGEEVASWQLPLTDVDMVSDMRTWVGRDGEIGMLATVNPVGAHLFHPASGVLRSLILHTLFPTPTSYFQPRLKLAPLKGLLHGQVLLQEEMSDKMVLVDVTTGEFQPISQAPTDGLLSRAAKSVRGPAVSDPFWRVLPESAADDGSLWRFQRGGTAFQRLNLLHSNALTVRLPDGAAPIRHAEALGPDRILLFLQDGSSWEASVGGKECGLRQLSQAPSLPLDRLQLSPQLAAEHSKALFSHLVPQGFHPAAFASGDDFAFGRALCGFPVGEDQAGKLVQWSKDPAEEKLGLERPYWASPQALDLVHPGSTQAFLPTAGQSVRSLALWEAPLRALPEGTKLGDVTGFLEVADVLGGSVSYLPVPAPKYGGTRYPAWLCSLSGSRFVLCPRSGGEGVWTADSGGAVREWETSSTSLSNSLGAWERMMGGEGGPQLDLELQRPDGGLDKLTEPKHGQVDPANTPHVGGGTWAGGTGGFNTAGLGGVGGPYRLDAGHPVHQAPEELKAQVPEHVRAKAREMAVRARAQRLKEIQMADHDAATYDKLYKRVEREVNLLRVILESLQAKGKERQWVRHQTSGDVDEGKLVEGVTGEKAVYRRRAEKEPEPGTPQTKPKKLTLCLDVSGSMYRFNGYDGRLHKSLEATLMVMEALAGFQDKIQYQLVGHSGEEAEIPLGATFARPPKDEKERLDVLKTMTTHSQYCMSGDHTLEATKAAVHSLAKEEDADERFVIMISDANLDRYGIRPGALARLLTAEPHVHAFAIFIGSLGEQAESLRKGLPAGKGFVCKDSGDIPHILQQIFATAVLNDGDD